MTHRVAPAPQTDGSCCNGTGYADYAAVPCPNPHCPVPWPPAAPEGARAEDLPIGTVERRPLTPEVAKRCAAALETAVERLDLVLAYLQAVDQLTECEVLEGLRRGVQAFNRDHIGATP